MTATSGPGISLMTEFVGMAYFAEIPGVIWDIQRMGPSTGLPTRDSQGDVLKAYYLGHGDTRNVFLLPGTMAECFEFGWRAFDLAERLQTPVFVLSDLDLGMNLWMTEPFAYPDKPMDRGKVLSAGGLERLERLRPLQGRMTATASATARCPAPSNPLAAYFTRGTGHNEKAGYSERPDDWENNLSRLARKHETRAHAGARSRSSTSATGAKVGIIAYGSTDPAIRGGARHACARAGSKTSYLPRARPAARRGDGGLSGEVRSRLCGRDELRRPDVLSWCACMRRSTRRTCCPSPTATACR